LVLAGRDPTANQHSADSHGITGGLHWLVSIMRKAPFSEKSRQRMDLALADAVIVDTTSV
jgi:hypothetical protein